jgi:hypothetical protein
MTDTVRDEITHLAGSIRALQRQLELALAKRRVELNYKVQDGVVQFEQVMIAKHRLLKARMLNYIFGARPAMILTAPVIYSLIIPLMLLDVFGPYIRRRASQCMPYHACAGVIIWHLTEGN